MSEKKKVIIAALWDNENYGNRIQAIALKRTIEDFGYHVTFARVVPYSILYNLKKRIVIALGYLGVPRFQSSSKFYLRSFSIKRKERKFYSPMLNRIHRYRFHKKIRQEDYDAAVTGSDKVWYKWHNNPNELPYFYLQFMPPEKRISYAASFGFEEFPAEDYEQHRVGLNGMRYISCREKSGCKLVEQVTGRPGELVLDPTLCLGPRFWAGLEIKPVCAGSRKRYLLIYMLGKQEKYRKAIEAYAKERRLEIIDLYDVRRTDVWKTTVEGFLWLIHHAKMICTDSFHCTVFSILYEMPFQVFRRQSEGFEQMYDRIETLLELTGLESCQFDGEMVRRVDIDYSYARKRIEEEKERSINWLKNALYEVTK